MESPVTFGKTDYVMMGLMLFVSLAIGVFFAVSGNRQRTQVEYLLGGRSMGVVPVCLSLFATFNSAISLLGIPAEVYAYGTMMLYQSISTCLASILCLWTLLPLIYPLKITSIYEYLERRFESKSIRLMGATIGMISNMSYMVVALLSPALALQTAAGLPLWISIVIVGAVGTLYTSIGGIRSVVWADAFQSVIIFGGIITTLIKGCTDVGGFGEVWAKADIRGRLVFDEVDPDPRVRHTIWGLLVGGTAFWMSVNFGQSYTQRLISTKSQNDAKKVIWFAVPITLLYNVILIMTGLTLLVYFDVIGCDPLAAGFIKNANQLVPYFVIRTLGSIPGLAGLYISTIFSGALSTLSSGINSLAANTVEDMAKSCLGTRESTATVISKLLVALYGCLITALAYLAQEVKGPVTQITITALGASGGPVFGLFLLAGIFPQANTVGASAGCMTGLFLCVWLSLFKMFYGQRTPPLPPGRVDSCVDSNHSNTTAASATASTSLFNALNLSSGAADIATTPTLLTASVTDINSNEYTSFKIEDISYIWVPVLGIMVVIIIGLLTSKIYECMSGSRKRSKPEYLFPFARRLWYGSQSDPKQDQMELESMLKDRI